MKCMTLNIWNYHRPWPKRRKIIASLIDAHQPDVAMLQEARHDWRFAHGRGQGEQIADLTGYHSTWELGQVYVPLLRIDEGLAILTRGVPSRVMARQLTRFPREREDSNQRLCLGVSIVVDETEIHAYATHFSLSPSARVSNAVEVSRFIRQESGDAPAIVMGDLNSEPGTTPIRFLTGVEEVAGESGDFVDCWAHANPSAPGHTYASWEPVRRIDYVLARNLASPPTCAAIIGREPVDGVYASDHAGIIVEIPLS